MSADLHPDLPQSSKTLALIGRAYLKSIGWTLEGKLPTDVPRAIMIAAPHTSNWDLPHMLAVAWAFRLRVSWIGKHTLFDGRAGGFMKWLGGIPVDRRGRHGYVRQVADRIRSEDGIVLAVAPAGTRGKAPQWKSGFYHMANEARVPILCGFLDFKRKVGGVGPAVMPTGNMKADMDKIRAFYAGKEGLHHDKTSKVRLKAEDEEPVAHAAAAE